MVLNDLYKKQGVLQSELDVPFTNLHDVTSWIEEFCEIINDCLLPHADVFEVNFIFVVSYWDSSIARILHLCIAWVF
jgi:hypothetical protein